ncbi:MAG: DUF5671 domain-containing protein [Patescibacteria group bacterium]|jgi:hypothetical protein
MDNTKNNSAKFAFLYLLALVALGFVSVNVGQIIFQLINKYIVDILSQNNAAFSSDILKFAIASLVIATPTYYFCNKFIYGSLYKGELDKESGVRKWLTYLIIFIAFLVMIGSLIAILVNFLNGALTTQIILKSLTTLVISGIVFSFYFYDIRREKTAGYKDSVIKIYFFASLAVIIVTFVASLFIVESPQVARNRQIDQRVTNNFYQIDQDLNNYYQTYKKLPADFNALKAEYTYISDDLLKNPKTQEIFKYQVKGDREYELCTTFLTDASANTQNKDMAYYYDTRWPHGIGYQCLTQKVQAFNKDGSPVQVAPPVPVK